MHTFTLVFMQVTIQLYGWVCKMLKMKIHTWSVPASDFLPAILNLYGSRAGMTSLSWLRCRRVRPMLRALSLCNTTEAEDALWRSSPLSRRNLWLNWKLKKEEFYFPFLWFLGWLNLALLGHYIDRPNEKICLMCVKCILSLSPHECPGKYHYRQKFRLKSTCPLIL